MTVPATYTYELLLPGYKVLHRTTVLPTYLHVLFPLQVHSSAAGSGLQLGLQAEDHPHGGGSEGPHLASSVQVRGSARAPVTASCGLLLRR